VTHELTTLSSGGVRVVTESVSTVRSVALGMWVGVGSRDEHDHQLGCSHFLEHLLFKGTATRSAQDIAEAIDAVGGEMNAFTTKEVTCFWARVLDTDVALAADLLGDMLTASTNAPEDVEAERQVVLEEINIHFDSPDDLAHSDLCTAVLGDHALALETLGSRDSITTMDRATIHAYWEEHYRPANVVVAAAGNVSHDTIVQLVERHVGDLGRPGGDRPERSEPSLDGGCASVRHRPTEQAHVVIGGPAVSAVDERRWAFRVLQDALGGGMSSRLFQEIRERRGLAYSTYSYGVEHADIGYHGAYAGTAPKHVDEVIEVLRDELDRVVDDLAAEEVDRSKGSLKGGLVLGSEDTGARMHRLGRQAIGDRQILSIDDAIEAVDAVDLDEVRTVAKDILGQARSLSVVGPFDEDDDRFAALLAG